MSYRSLQIVKVANPVRQMDSESVAIVQGGDEHAVALDNAAGNRPDRIGHLGMGWDDEAGVKPLGRARHVRLDRRTDSYHRSPECDRELEIAVAIVI
jgi:hypothetical protein